LLAIKEVDASLRVGGPSAARGDWVLDLIEFGRKNDCEPDYIITHVYNNDPEWAALSPFDGPQEDKASKSPHFAAAVMRGVRRELDTHGFKGEVHWNEWGRSWLPHDPVRETANEAAFVVKTMAEVSQLADYYAYWCLSDIYDQVGYGREPFHGNYGLLNLQGLRKPAYHAFQLLSLLGDERVLVGQLQSKNALQSASGEVTVTHENGVPEACFNLETPGVALLLCEQA
jgi:xylan 1,4-beta-xylosidase